MISSKTYDLIIFGAGFSGLSSAYYFRKKYPQKKILIIEKDKDAGGLASNIKFKNFKLEKFYHHWYEHDKEIFDLIKEIKCTNKIFKTNVTTGMYYANKKYRFSNLTDIISFNALSIVGRIRLLFFLLYCRIKKNWLSLDNQTAVNWLKNICGNEVFDVIWKPLLIGKFGRFYNKISAAWIWKRIKDRSENKKNFSSKDEYYYYKGGFGDLALDIVNYLKNFKNIDYISGVNIKSIDIYKNKENLFNIKGSTNNICCYGKKILFTIPNQEIIKIAKKILTKNEINKLNSIKYFGNICLILFLKKSLSSQYWMNINDASFPFVAVIEHTNLVSNKEFKNNHVVYLSKYLDVQSYLYRLSKKNYFLFSFKHLNKIFPSLKKSDVITFYLNKAEYAQPLTFRNYLKKKIPYTLSNENIHIVNMTQIYPKDRSTNNAVFEAKKVIQEI
jgi:protoporphyrinogen oxidase